MLKRDSVLEMRIPEMAEVVREVVDVRGRETLDVVGSETLDDLARRLYREGLDRGVRRLGGAVRGEEEEWERGLGGCSECLGLGLGSDVVLLLLVGGRGNDSMLTVLRRLLEVGNRDNEAEADGEGEEARVRSVGMDGDDWRERGIVDFVVVRAADADAAAASLPLCLSDDDGDDAAAAARAAPAAGAAAAASAPPPPPPAAAAAPAL
jgi:hypothetical protein